MDGDGDEVALSRSFQLCYTCSHENKEGEQCPGTAHRSLAASSVLSDSERSGLDSDCDSDVGSSSGCFRGEEVET